MAKRSHLQEPRSGQRFYFFDIAGDIGKIRHETNNVIPSLIIHFHWSKLSIAA